MKILRELFFSCIIAAIWFAIGLTMPGCATKPPMKMDEHAVSIGTDSVKKLETEETTGLKNEISAVVEDVVSAIDEVVDVVINRVTYSPPDSTGKQYILDETTTTINKQSNREDKKTTTRKDTIAATINTNKNATTDRLTTTETNNHVQVERMAAITWWQAALMFLGGASLVYIGVKIYRRKLP